MRFEYFAAILSGITILGVTAYFGLKKDKRWDENDDPSKVERSIVLEEPDMAHIKANPKILIDWGDETSLAGLKWKDEKGILHPDVQYEEKGGDTALHMFAEEGYAKCLKFLLDRGFNRTIKNNKGLTPADVARNNGFENVARLLETYKLKPSKENNYKEIDEDEKGFDYGDIDDSKKEESPILDSLRQLYYDWKNDNKNTKSNQNKNNKKSKKKSH